MAIKLSRVTFTGADDSVRGVELRAFMQRANLPSFIEWGILVSSGKGGRNRFPSEKRIDEFVYDLAGAGCFLSMHVCGQWVDEIAVGDWGGLIRAYGMKVLNRFDRVQLNFHGEERDIDAGRMLAGIRKMERYFDVILQMDGVNDGLLEACHFHGVNAFPLFDLSHGAGVLPESWPAPHEKSYTGYAGGLGPDNIDDELPKIAAAAAGREFWIDMETKIRSHDDQQFDLGACRRVMEGIDRYFKAERLAASH